MNKKQSRNISHVSKDVNVLVENLTQGKNGTVINVCVSVKTKKTLCI